MTQTRQFAYDVKGEIIAYRHEWNVVAVHLAYHESYNSGGQLERTLRLTMSGNALNVDTRPETIGQLIEMFQQAKEKMESVIPVLLQEKLKGAQPL